MLSAGAVPQNFYGNFFLRGSDLLAVPTIDSDKAFGIELKIEETGIPSANVSIQAALLCACLLVSR